MDLKFPATAGAAALLVLCALPGTAHATLGGDAATIAADQTLMQATQRVANTQVGAATGLYTVQAISLPSGTTVREYLGADGMVFGVAWEGPFMPDLEQLFGAYFNEFVAGAQTSHTLNGAHRGPLSINQGDLVVQSGGRMRAYIGRAYLPQQVPQGVTVDQIK
jgi:hypothetical protein